MSSRGRALGAWVAFCSATLAWADAAPDAGVPSAEPSTVVRGTRAVHSASETVVPREVVQAAPRAGATDLLRLVPGLVASQHSGEGKAHQLFLRGFDAVHGQDVELSVAGVPVNEPSHLHAQGYADLNWLIPEVVREVRVTEGSTRAWQADFAVAGTVRYELGLDTPGLTVALGHGSFGRTRLFGGFRPRRADAQTFLAAEYVEGDGVGPQRAFHRFSSMGQWQQRFEQVQLRAMLASYQAAFESPGVLADGATDFFAARGQNQGGAAARHVALVGATLQHALGRSALEFTGQRVDLTLRNNFTGLLRDPRGDGLQQVQGAWIFTGKATHQQALALAGQHFHLDAGLSVRHDRIEQTQRGYDEATGALREVVLDGPATRFREAIDARVQQTLGSGWAELAWAPAGWRFMLGGRVDVLHVDTFDGLAYQGAGTTRRSTGPHAGLKVGVERGVGDAFKVFLNYGDGFRSPQARQLSNGETAPFVNVHGGELGVRYESARLSASALGFASWVQNDFFFDHTVGTTTYVGASLRGGGQLAVTARPLDDLVLSANVTAAQAHLLATNTLLPYFAPLVGRVDGSWRHPFTVTGQTVTPFIGVGATLIGPRPLPYDEFSRTVFLLDARVGVALGPVELSLDVQNLLDSRWRDGEFVFASKWDASDAATLLPVRQFTAGAPRTVFVHLEVHL